MRKIQFYHKYWTRRPVLGVNTLMLGKPEKGKMVENLLLQMAQTGQICSRVTEDELIKLLENVSSRTQSKTSVKFDRRRAALDSDDEDL
ncbi:unnamed protein product [Acanthoscelides obtectus]|uniref:Programmed cell death protein 5 n=1 Tax=Acanthoscelides obtectus TaxID=200917 RepID=A0A9P0JMH8_ACAOB|nr:unnamed protein product [Acanthoscelides obtectus]CAK1634694.1 Uncharacterized protein D2005.3 [Acanthoscelides obtectus]